MMKKLECKDCGVLKTKENTGRYIDKRDGRTYLYSRCRKCSRAYYTLHDAKPEAKAKKKEYNAKPGAKTKQREYAGDYRADPINKTRRNENQKVRYTEDLEYRTTLLLRTRFRKAVGSKNKTNGEALELLDCSIPEFHDYIESKFQPGMTWENRGGKTGWQYDHIIPIDAFDQLDPFYRAVCWHYTNFQPLWPPDNLAKGAKLPE